MADVHSKEIRSYNMSRIRSKDTKPEMMVRRFLHAQGFRYRLHVKDLPGKPDVVLPRYKTVIFVHGCFWHGHQGCRYFVIPKTRTDWWMHKIENNITNDFRVEGQLRAAGWRIIKIWECELKKCVFESTLTKLTSFLKSLL